jgi:LEA14-like dessication related protein
MRAPAALLCALALLPGCAELGKLAAAAVDPPKLTFRSVDLRSLDLEGATMGFNFDVENRNRFGLEVARIAYALEVEGTRVTGGDVPGGLKLPAEGMAPLTFTSRLRYSDVPGIASLLGKREAVRYKLSGTVGVQTALGVIELPMSHEDSVNLPRAPRFSLDGLSIRSASLDRVTLELRVRVENPNAFSLPAGKLDSAFSLGGAQVARIDGQALSALLGSGNAVVAIPIAVDLAEAGRAAAELLRGGKADVALRGNADVAGMKIPLDLGGNVSADH